uniref:putative peptidoglycan-binding domain-containing protein n=1 Tax=Cochlodiniinecator piscidefendens TaxID=2715756 RepID=UPI001409E3CC
MFAKAGALLVDADGIARRDYYFVLADRRRASRKYARTRNGGKGGWIKRAEEFISAPFELSNSEFQERVSAWA